VSAGLYCASPRRKWSAAINKDL